MERPGLSVRQKYTRAVLFYIPVGLLVTIVCVAVFGPVGFISVLPYTLIYTWLLFQFRCPTCGRAVAMNKTLWQTLPQKRCLRCGTWLDA